MTRVILRSLLWTIGELTCTALYKLDLLLLYTFIHGSCRKVLITRETTYEPNP